MKRALLALSVLLACGHADVSRAAEDPLARAYGDFVVQVKAQAAASGPSIARAMTSREYHAILDMIYGAIPVPQRLAFEFGGASQSWVLLDGRFPDGDGCFLKIDLSKGDATTYETGRIARVTLYKARPPLSDGSPDLSTDLDNLFDGFEIAPRRIDPASKRYDERFVAVDVQPDDLVLEETSGSVLSIPTTKTFELRTRFDGSILSFTITGLPHLREALGAGWRPSRSCEFPPSARFEQKPF